MIDLVEFGLRLQLERRRLSLRQEDFGLRAGVSRACQANYESGKTPPDIVYMDRLADLGVDVNRLLTGRASSEVAFDLFDWDLAADILAAIQNFPSEVKISISPQKQIALLKFLYRQSARNRQVDQSALRELIYLSSSNDPLTPAEGNT